MMQQLCVGHPSQIPQPTVSQQDKSEANHMLTPRVQAGTKVSPEISVKAASPAEGSTNSSPFKENTEN